MPTKPKRLQAKSYKRAERQRVSSSKRGYDRKWRKARELYLQQYPLCRHCEAEGVIKAADVVDHITPHKGDVDLFWDINNWQPLCKRHHDIKTAREDGGFGNARSNKKPGCDENGIPLDANSHWHE